MTISVLERGTEMEAGHPPQPHILPLPSGTATLWHLLRNLLLLSLCVLGALALCEILARVVIPPTGTQNKLTAMDRCRSDVQVAIAGSSRASHGLDPRGMPWIAYNFGSDAQSANFSTQILLREADRLPHLKAMILVLDEFAFGMDDTEVTAPDYLLRGYVLLHEDQTQLWLCGVSQLFRHRHQLLPRLLEAVWRTSRPVTPVYDTDDPPRRDRDCILTRTGLHWWPPRVVDLSVEYGKHQARDMVNNYARGLRADNMRVLRDFLQAALRRHLRVVLVQPPLYATYRRAVAPATFAEYQNDIRTLLKVVGSSDVRFRSYINDSRISDHDFQDTNHLNSLGAMHWAQLVSRDFADFIR